MPYLISNDSHSIRQSMDQHDAYDLHRWRHICKYCHDMESIIEDKIEEDGDSCDLVEDARELSVNTSLKTERDFMKNIGDHLEGVNLVRFIMKMEKVIKEYDEQDELDVKVAGSISRLYSMWIYVITDEVSFEIIEYDDGSESADEVILLRPSKL